MTRTCDAGVFESTTCKTSPNRVLLGYLMSISALVESFALTDSAAFQDAPFYGHGQRAMCPDYLSDWSFH